MSRSELEMRPFSKAISSAIYNGSWQLTIRDRTGSVTGPGPGRSRTGSDRRRSNFWTGAGSLFAFLRCLCIKADNVETVKP